MKFLDFLSEATSINRTYLDLLFKTLIFWIILEIIKKIILRCIKNFNDNKKEYTTSQSVKIIISVCKWLVIVLIWSKYLNNLLTLITVLSGALTIAVRDLIWNYFTGFYIRANKTFDLEDRIEINGHKGDVINFNRLSFDLLEVNNEDNIGQSTGVITHFPNAVVFTHPIRNYSKVNFIWDELTVRIPLDFDLEKAKAIIYRIVNTNEIIKDNPAHFKHDINNLSTDYRIYYNQSDPVIYVKVMGDYAEYTVRYLVQPKKARYVNSLIWKELLVSHQKGELILYNKDYIYKSDFFAKLKKK